jgi:hypothetical protein
MRSPNDGDEELRKSVSKNETRAQWGGAAVVFGLIIEVVLTATYRHGESIVEGWGPVFADALIALGVASEILFATQARSKAEALQHRSDEKVAEANKIAAMANERAVELQIALDKERHKRLGRALTKEQWDVLQTLRGKVSKVVIICDRDVEALYFSGQLTTALRDAGIQIEMRPPEPSNIWTGVQVWLGAGWQGDAREHPLIKSFMEIGLFGGSGFFSEIPGISPDAPLLLIGRKNVEFDDRYFPPPKS